MRKAILLILILILITPLQGYLPSIHLIEPAIPESMVIDYENDLIIHRITIRAEPPSKDEANYWSESDDIPTGFLIPPNALRAQANALDDLIDIEPGTYVSFYDEYGEQTIRYLAITYTWNGTIPPMVDGSATLAVVNPPAAVRVDRPGSVIRTDVPYYDYQKIQERDTPLSESASLSTIVKPGDTINLRTGPTRWHIITWQEYLILSTIVLGIILFAVLPIIIVAQVPERTIIWTGAGVITTAIILITSTNNYAQGFVMPLFNKLPFIGLLALTGYAVSSIGSFFIIYKRTTLLKTIGTLITALVLLFVAESVYFTMNPMILY